MNIFHEQFSTGQVAAASGASNATLQSWLKRDLVVGHRGPAPIEGGGSPGRHRKFSFFNVMEIAVAKALLDAGLGSGNVENAFAAASYFAHMGAFVSHWTGETVPPTLRDPSLPINPNVKRCKTLLCVAGPQSTIVGWDGEEDVYQTARHQLGSPDGFVILEINDLFHRVVKALGHDPWEVLRLAYPTPDVNAAEADKQ